MTSRLGFRGNFYGREEELRLLEETFLRAKDASQLVLLSGETGVGKSRLVDKKFNETLGLSYFYVTSKADGISTKPYMFLARAFSALFQKVIDQRGEAWLLDFRRKIQEALGNEGQLVTNRVSGLEHFLGWKVSEPRPVALDASVHRLSYVFQRFARVLCSDRVVVCFWTICSGPTLVPCSCCA